MVQLNGYASGLLCVKQEETWWEGQYRERWNKTWNEGRYSWVHKYGKSSSGEHWDTHVQQDTCDAMVIVCSGFVEVVVLSLLNVQASTSQQCSGAGLDELAVKRFNSGGLLWFRLSGGSQPMSQRHSGAPVAGVGEVMFEEEDEGVACDVRFEEGDEGDRGLHTIR
ncbi:hypothetical protein L2E82_22756 [Cichorium intybus]|uniref:Uncharacterized protein n=1 Tax=Cichorium intybus TaxID=13427 RepID=A0ACB9DYM8_CICIN|nr:hypothetical protein L2E82_22756 [Cichorium intybus]